MEQASCQLTSSASSQTQDSHELGPAEKKRTRSSWRTTVCAINTAYQPELDGIRAIAILAVIFFHSGARWLPGGFLGVDVFFVVSGYLITGLLIKEHRTKGQIQMLAFWGRRGRRLIPAFLAMLVVTTTCAAVFMQDAIATTVRDLPWAFLGLSNWNFILRHSSYFEAMGRPSLFQHTWSLAVEAQFYLFWPFLLSLILSIWGVCGIRRVASICASSSAIALFLVLRTAESAESRAMSHAYFGTDTHTVGLFLGAMLATVLFPGALRIKPAAASAMGIVSTVSLFLLFHFTDESDSRSLLFGILAASVLTTILIAVTTTMQGSVMSKALAIRPLRWIGDRSYSLYLWHWPVFQATRPDIDIRLNAVLALSLRLVLTAALAEMSYRFVEVPFRRGGLSRARLAIGFWDIRVRRLVLTSAVTCVLTLAGVEVWLIKKGIQAGDTASKSHEPLTPTQTPFKTSLPFRMTDADAAKLHLSHTEHSHLNTKALPVTKLLKALPLEPDQVNTALGRPAILLGDSVLLRVSQFIAQQVNVTKVDAVVGRQAKELQARAEQLARTGSLPPTIILDLGNNGMIEEATLKAILNAFKTCQQVVVVNARVPRPWQDGDDDLIARIVPLYPNAVLADWRKISTGHAEYFGPDGVHPNALGARAYASLVVSALQGEPSLQTSPLDIVAWK